MKRGKDDDYQITLRNFLLAGHDDYDDDDDDDDRDNHDDGYYKITFQDGQTEAVRRCEAFWHFAIRLQPSDDHYHFSQHDLFMILLNFLNELIMLRTILCVIYFEESPKRTCSFFIFLRDFHIDLFKEQL